MEDLVGCNEFDHFLETTDNGLMEFGDETNLIKMHRKYITYFRSISLKFYHVTMPSKFVADLSFIHFFWNGREKTETIYPKTNENFEFVI